MSKLKIFWFWCKIQRKKQNLSDSEKETHPARYALTEIVNIHDEALEFEPIHRIVFDVDSEKLLKEFSEYTLN